MKNRQVNIGIIGLGTVGTGVARILLEQKELLTTRSTLSFNLKTIAELDWNKDRNLDLSQVNCTTDVDELLNDPEINIVVETIGGYEPAFTFISKALKNRKHVVTANKALIATKGMELYKIAQENGVDFLFEASVGGGIPIIKGLREGLVANRFESIYGILNGTTNYILTKMHRDGLEFDEALKGAQEKGFAEANPTLDISGGDAAHKLTILSSIASNSFIPFDKIYMEGITGITKMDITFAQSFGMTIKLLAIYRAYKDGLDLRVHPTLINNSHLLAAVSNELNAIFVKGDFVGDTMFYGPGAGERPTASAIISDIVDLSRDLLLQEGEKYCNRAISLTQNVQLIPIEDVTSRFYLRFMTKDIPGVLSMISGVLAENGISISSMVQLESHEKDNYVPIVLLTHEALEKSMERALQKIVKFDFVKEDYLRLRIFEES
ncbi:MAG: homoserine dehydrogenase [Clostridiaceae bacterium]|jgi:homoserine dehydrogenase|nr:homoserine dehydrogenase [Clostridiaceae bacterium]